jgi:signal transduction histidine kinase
MAHTSSDFSWGLSQRFSRSCIATFAFLTLAFLLVCWTIWRILFVGIRCVLEIIPEIGHPDVTPTMRFRDFMYRCLWHALLVVATSTVGNLTTATSALAPTLVPTLVPLLQRSTTQSFVSAGDAVVKPIAAPMHNKLDSLKRQLALATADTARVRLLNDIAALLRNSQYDSALVYAEQARTLARTLGMQHQEALALLSLGVVRIYQGQYSLAIELHLQAQHVAEQINDKESIAYVLNNLGYMYKSQRQLDSALSYFQRSYTILEHIKDYDAMAMAAGNISDVLQLRNRPAEAIDFARKALAISRQGAQVFIVSLSQYHLGVAFGKASLYDSAAYFTRQALQAFEQSHETKYIAKSLAHLAWLSLQQQKVNEALRYAQQGIEAAERLPTQDELRSLKVILTDIYAAQGRYREALAEHREAAALQDSLQTTDINQRIQALEILYRSNEQAQQLALAAQQRDNQLLLRNALLGGLILVCALCLLAINRYRLKARSEQALQNINTELRRQQEQLEQQARQIQEVNVELATKNLELNLVNEHLEHSNQKLTALDAEKNNLLSLVAHDLKNPLAGITLGASTLRRQGHTISPERLAALSEGILTSAQRMATLVDNLLDLNALETGSLRLTPTPLELAPLAASIVEQHEFYAASKSITLHFSASPSPLESSHLTHSNSQCPEYRVIADRNAVLQIMDNLVSNAIKYSPTHKQVFVNVTATPEHTRFEVRDQGPGISDDDKELLFRKFTRLSARPTAGEQSSGLGLSIVKKLTEAMKGKVWCESTVGLGTTFIVEFPTLSHIGTESQIA